jgi:hypothetical protein
MGLDGIIYTLRFRKIGIYVKRLFNFRLSSLNSCNVGVTDGKDLWNKPLRLANIYGQNSVRIGSGI